MKRNKKIGTVRFIKMNGDRLAEAAEEEEEEEGKSLRTVDGVGQNGGMRCKVGQRCQEREEALAFINSRERRISFNFFYTPIFSVDFFDFLRFAPDSSSIFLSPASVPCFSIFQFFIWLRNQPGR